MLIGAAAREAGVSRDTVRFYTRMGLVSCTERRAGSRSYADYDQDAVQLIRDIKTAQSLGFTLAELRPVLAVYLAGELDQPRQRALMMSKLQDIEEKQRALSAMADFIRTKVAEIDSAQPDQEVRIP
jgi:DNA-binding transcriptional MerR regulator